MAVNRASQNARQPAVPWPSEPNPRGAAARRHNRDGCIIGAAQYEAAKAQKAADADAKQAKKLATERAAWESRRVDVRAAESALAAADGEPGKLSVKFLRALIYSRTGRTPSAKNNHEGALLTEARTALGARCATLLPPTPPRAPALDADRAEDLCPNCQAAVDDTPDENGMIWILV